MKTSKQQIHAPLKTGALVARRTVTLGLGYVAILAVAYDGPNEPQPATGAQWPPETDWPAAKLTVSIPYHDGDNGTCKPDGHIQCAATLCGQYLNRFWGIRGILNEISVLYRERRATGSSLRSVAAQLLRETIAELRPVQVHLKAREARIKQREATLLAGMDIREIGKQQA